MEEKGTKPSKVKAEEEAEEGEAEAEEERAKGRQVLFDLGRKMRVFGDGTTLCTQHTVFCAHSSTIHHNTFQKKQVLVTSPKKKEVFGGKKLIFAHQTHTQP